MHRIHYKQFGSQRDSCKLLIKYHTLYFLLGNISIQCYKTDGTEQIKEYSTIELQMVNSSFNGQAIEHTAPFHTTMNKPFNSSKVAVATTRFFMSNFDNANELRDLDGISNIGVFH